MVIPFTPTCHIPHKLYFMYFIHLYGRGVGFKGSGLVFCCFFCLFSRDILLHCVNGCQLHIIVNVKMGFLWKQGHYSHIYATVAIEVNPKGLLRIQLLKAIYRPYGSLPKHLFMCVCISISSLMCF